MIMCKNGLCVLWFQNEMPPWAHVLKAWSSFGGTVLGGARNFRRWDLAQGSWLLGAFTSLYYEVICPEHKLSLLCVQS